MKGENLRRLTMTIDTDKYEGHTPAPWRAHNDLYKNGIDENNLGQVESFRLSWGVTLSEERLDDYRENRIGHHVMHIADAQLIADAPDLLAEVKRLRKQVLALLHENERLEAMYHMDVHGDDTLANLLERKK